MVGWERGKIIIIISILRTVENIWLKLFAVLKFSVLIISLLFPQTKPCSWLLFICPSHALTNPPPAVRDKRCTAVPFPSHRTVISRELRAVWWERIPEPIQTCCPLFFFFFPCGMSVLPSAFINLDKSCWFSFFFFFPIPHGMTSWPAGQVLMLEWVSAALSSAWIKKKSPPLQLHWQGCAKTNTGPRSSLIRIDPVVRFILFYWIVTPAWYHSALCKGRLCCCCFSRPVQCLTTCCCCRVRGARLFPFLFSFKSVCRRPCVAGLYLNILLPCCCGLEYSCSVADPGGCCLEQRAYLYCKFVFFFAITCVPSSCPFPVPLPN